MSAFCDRLVTAHLHTYRFRARSHIAPKNAWKTLGTLLSPFFQSVRAVALRRHLSLLSNHQLRSPLQEGNFVTWLVVRLRHSEKLRCFYLDAARTRLEKTSVSPRDQYERAYRASTFEITNLSAQKTRYVSGPLLCCCVPLCSLTHRTLRREQRALSLCLSLSHSGSRVFSVNV